MLCRCPRFHQACPQELGPGAGPAGRLVEGHARGGPEGRGWPPPSVLGAGQTTALGRVDTVLLRVSALLKSETGRRWAGGCCLARTLPASFSFLKWCRLPFPLCSRLCFLREACQDKLRSWLLGGGFQSAFGPWRGSQCRRPVSAAAPIPAAPHSLPLDLPFSLHLLQGPPGSPLHGPRSGAGLEPGAGLCASGPSCVSLCVTSRCP